MIRKSRICQYLANFTELVWEGELIARTVCQCFNSKFCILPKSSPRTIYIFNGLSLPTTPYGTMLMHHLLNRPQMPWSRRDFAIVLQLAQNRHTTGLFYSFVNMAKRLHWTGAVVCNTLLQIFWRRTRCSPSRVPRNCLHSFSPSWLELRLLSWRFSFQFPLNYVHFRCLLLYAFPCPLCFSHLLRDLACKCLHLWRALWKYAAEWHACVRAEVAASDKTVHHQIKASLILWMSLACHHQI